MQKFKEDIVKMIRIRATLSVLILSFAFITLLLIFYSNRHDKDIVIYLLGHITSYPISILGYYFVSSHREKNTHEDTSDDKGTLSSP